MPKQSLDDDAETIFTKNVLLLYLSTIIQYRWREQQQIDLMHDDVVVVNIRFRTKYYEECGEYSSHS